MVIHFFQKSSMVSLEELSICSVDIPCKAEALPATFRRPGTAWPRVPDVGLGEGDFRTYQSQKPRTQLWLGQPKHRPRSLWKKIRFLSKHNLKNIFYSMLSTRIYSRISREILDKFWTFSSSFDLYAGHKKEQFNVQGWNRISIAVTGIGRDTRRQSF